MAQRALEGPPFPDALSYLWEIFTRLDGMRAVGQYGFERFTPQHIESGCRLFGWTLAPHEVEALVQLDLATLYPGEPDTPRVQTAWPERKE